MDSEPLGTTFGVDGKVLAGPPYATAPVVEDYRSDRLILEELSSELARLHRRLDALEPYLPLLHRWFAMRQALGRTLGGMRHG